MEDGSLNSRYTIEYEPYNGTEGYRGTSTSIGDEAPISCSIKLLVAVGVVLLLVDIAVVVLFVRLF